MNYSNNLPATNFYALTASRATFNLNTLKGMKIMLSFYGSAYRQQCVKRLNQLKKHSQTFLDNQLVVVSVFRSMPDEILSFTGYVEAPFYAIADPMNLVYDQYCSGAIGSTLEFNFLSKYANGINAEEANAFSYDQPDDQRPFCMPADFLIDENFYINTAYYAASVTDQLPIIEVLKWLDVNKINLQSSTNNTYVSTLSQMHIL